MSEWEVVLTLITLVGFVTAIVTPLIKLNSTIVKLSAIVERLQKDFSKEEKTQSDIVSKLGDHETRITILERSEGNG